MILKNNSEGLNLVLKFRVEDYDYNVYVSSEKMKCFGCGMEGHLIRSCPEKKSLLRLIIKTQNMVSQVNLRDKNKMNWMNLRD